MANDYWRQLRKTSQFLHLEYGYDHTTLSAEKAEARPLGDWLELKFDLDSNLRSRNNKATNSYLGARDLSEGQISELKRVQIDDSRVIERLRNILRNNPQVADRWRLILFLSGPHTFSVHPEMPTGQGEPLWLTVVR